MIPRSSFIETQFPISKLSKESYKERKANYSQTLTGLGKWWGRKPLILVRAAIIGCLMPVSDDPAMDRQCFLKVLTMDEEGLWRRKDKSISLKEIYLRLTATQREEWFDPASTEEKPKYKKGITAEDKALLQKLIFSRLSYDEKLEYCLRPEQINGPSEEAWADINRHLGTSASNIAELVRELGKRRFGHVPRVGDAFCGGGSVPFEAARIGCDAYGSDLSPVAALLTWAALNIIGGGPDVASAVRHAQEEVYQAVDGQITEWKIEHNEKGWRADAYLYCAETVCPECGWRVPLAPAWVIGEKTRCVARLVPDPVHKRFEVAIESGVSADEMEEAKKSGTAVDSYLHCPNPACGQKTPISVIRERGGNGQGLRMWENDDVMPCPDDVFQERLYCIRWVETYVDNEGKEKTRRFYMAPDEEDCERERKVYELLMERFHDWQEKGYIPSKRIEPGDKTDEPIRTRGWTHWHHLFNPRQLILLGTVSSEVGELCSEREVLSALLLGIGKVINYSSKLSSWDSTITKEMVVWVFTNQALNTLFDYGTRGLSAIDTSWFYEINTCDISSKIARSAPCDAREAGMKSDIWLTDPPYADAINYHELSEFFLAWYEKHLQRLFPEWYADSKRALAITGTDEGFRRSMVDSYKNLANHMADDGMQVVMFTHQDARVWADLALILWASGLQVGAAWCIATETESALKKGNYVQGTVFLILRKRKTEETAYMDEVYAQVEAEVTTQLDSMFLLEDEKDPNFSDADFQLAAYAAALRVLTRYSAVEGVNITYELTRSRKKDEASPIEAVIADAVKIASDYLVPRGFDKVLWKFLLPIERLYLKGLEIESHGECRSGVYQEFARGLGVADYKALIGSGKANETRLKTATEFGTKELGDTAFGKSLVRNTLFAVREVGRTEEVQSGKMWLRNEVSDYWDQRKNIVKLLKYLETMGYTILHWRKDAEAARLLAGAVENDHV